MHADVQEWKALTRLTHLDATMWHGATAAEQALSLSQLHTLHLSVGLQPNGTPLCLKR